MAYIADWRLHREGMVSISSAYRPSSAGAATKGENTEDTEVQAKVTERILSRPFCLCQGSLQNLVQGARLFAILI